MPLPWLSLEERRFVRWLGRARDDFRIGSPFHRWRLASDHGNKIGEVGW